MQWLNLKRHHKGQIKHSGRIIMELPSWYKLPFSSNLDNKAPLATEWSLEMSGPCSRGKCGEGSAVGAEAEPSRAGLLGEAWLGKHLRPLPLLPPGMQATLDGPPALLMPRGFPSCLCVLTPGLSEESLSFETSHRATWHPYLRNGPPGEGAHLSVASSGSPPQEAVPSSDCPTLICTQSFN